MKRILYVIPGLGEKFSQKRYSKLTEYAKKHLLDIVPIHISRKYKTMTNYVDQFLAQCNQHGPSDQIYIFGFSFGAVISLIASTKIPITGQILCSLSPYFQEDLPLVPTRRKNFMGKKRIADFSTLSCDKLTKKVNAKTYIVYGKDEHLLVIKRANTVHKNIPGSVIVPVVGGKHDISQDVYDEAIMRLFDTIKWG